jgi:ribosomal-protein-alanine N-acetyltransferase
MKGDRQVSDFPTIQTARLVLREIVADDAADLFAIHGDAGLMRWFGVDPLKDLAGAQKLVELFASWRTQPNPGTRWAIQVKGESHLVGTCGLFAWHRLWRRCAIGYELAAAAQGKGYMHEALSAVLDWGFANMALNRVEAQVHPDNAASISSVSRLGFRQEGLLRELGYWGGQHHDMLQYSLLRRDWDARLR